MNDTTLLWLDIETTGLNPSHHALLEVAMRATRADLEPYAEYHAVLAYNGVTDDFIRRMHGPNGLLDECAGPDAPEKTTDHRAEHCLDDELNIARWLRDVIWAR